MFDDLEGAIENPGVWAVVLALISLTAAVSTGVHVLLKKRDARSAAYWLVIVTFVPLLGSVFYLLFGINLIRRQGRKLRQALPGVASDLFGAEFAGGGNCGVRAGAQGEGCWVECGVS